MDARFSDVSGYIFPEYRNLVATGTDLGKSRCDRAYKLPAIYQGLKLPNGKLYFIIKSVK